MKKTGKTLFFQFPKPIIFVGGLLLWLLALLSLTFGTAFSADIQATASVDKQELTLEDSVYFSIVVEGTRNSPPPELPSLDSFKIKPLGSSSSIQITNGSRSSSITYNYVLIPRTTGTFTISPATVTINGKRYQTSPITLVVRPPSETVDATKDVFAELVISNKNPYVQEQVNATLRIYHRVGIRNLDTEIRFPGFREEPLNEPVQNTRMIKGVRYLSYEISTALFPLRPGKIEIPASTIELDQIDRSRGGSDRDPFNPFNHGSIFNNFGRLNHKFLRTKAVTLNVQPLPPKDRPQNFSGLVGDFIISAQLSRTEVEVGDTTTLTVTVAGQGNIKDFSLPSPEWGKDFKVYEDQSDYRPTTSSLTVSGEKVYTFALVPLKPGKLEIPSISINYFDPTKGTYVSIQTQVRLLTVLPGQGNSHLKVVGPDSKVSTKKGNSVRNLGDDILPIHTGPEVFESQSLTGNSVLIYGIGLVLPAVLFFSYSLIHKRQQRLKYDIAFSRSQGAYKLSQKKLGALSPRNDARDTARELSLIVREYLGNILNLQGTAITATEVKDKMTKGNFGAEKIKATQELLQKYETFQYAPMDQNLPEDMVHETRSLLNQLEENS